MFGEEYIFSNYHINLYKKEVKINVLVLFIKTVLIINLNKIYLYFKVMNRTLVSLKTKLIVI